MSNELACTPLQIVNRSGIRQDHIGGHEVLGTGGLNLHAAIHVLNRRPAVHRPLATDLVGGIYDQYPPSCPCWFFEDGNLNDNRPGCLRHPSADRLEDVRVGDSLELLKLLVTGENPGTEQAPVDNPVDDTIRPALSDRLDRRTPRRENLMADRICVDSHKTMTSQDSSHLGFPGANSASKKPIHVPIRHKAPR